MLRSRGLIREANLALDSGISVGREATRLRPDDPFAHFVLGSVLAQRDKVDEAVGEFQEAIRLKPGYAAAHQNLGTARRRQGRSGDAVVALREAIRLEPHDHKSHAALGAALQPLGQLDLAVAELRETVRLMPDEAEGHCNLANLLRAQGRYAESLAEFERGHELGSKRADWTYPSAKWIEQARRVAQVERQFPAFLRGDVRPATNTERLDFAHVAHTRGLHATSARLWAEVFALAPNLASDPMNRLRHAATRCAVVAGCGKGKDEPPLDESGRSVWRRQAREWLAADLAAWSKIVAAGPSAARSTACQALQSWTTDQDLADVRDSIALAKLPEAERAEWLNLWAEVQRLVGLGDSPVSP